MKKNINLSLFSIYFLLFGVQNLFGQCMSPLSEPNFEHQRQFSKVSKPWSLHGTGGINIVEHPTQFDKTNIWLGTTTGWNGIEQSMTLFANTPYTVIVSIRASENMPMGTVGFKNQTRRIQAQVNIGTQNYYKIFKLHFTPRTTGVYILYTGFWASDVDSWMNISSVDIRFPCSG